MTVAHRVARARLGIDFGTSSTVAVVALPQRDPRPLLFDGSPLLPSAVCVEQTGRILVGRDALHTAMSIPEAFEPYPKQRIDDGTVLLGGAEIAVSRLYQAVLDRVVSDARHVTGRLADEPLDVVLTCPAAWGRQRRATLLAAAPPGARLVDEPVAAAHHFVDLAGTDLADGRTAVVYDLGAGTFDAAVVRRTGAGFAVVAAEGVADCGGLDIDAAIVRHLAGAVPDAAAWHRLNQPATAVDRRARQQLWENVRAGKEMLSRTALTHIHLPILEADVPLGRETLEELAAPIIERTVATVRAALRGAGVAATDLAAILLAGGSSRMPAVATALHRAFGIVPSTVDQPELAVAEGSLRAPAATQPPPDRPQPPPAASSPPGPTWPTHPAGPAQQVAVATPASADHRRAWQIALAGLATVGVLAAAAIVFYAIGREPPVVARPSESASPTPTPSPSPTYPPGIDPCLLGTWRTTLSSVYGLIDRERVQYVGGADTTITYKTDNTYTYDYAATKPMSATYGGQTFSYVYRGTATIRYHAEGNTTLLSMVRNDSTIETRRDGSVTYQGPSGPFLLEPQQYRCTTERLLLASSQGNYTIEAVRVSTATIPGPD